MHIVNKVLNIIFLPEIYYKTINYEKLFFINSRVKGHIDSYNG